MNEITLNHSHKFFIKADQTILDAALKSNISWPHSCENGRCNSCKCKIVSGTTIAIYPESNLTSEEKKDGWILACLRKVNSNVTLTIPSFENKNLPAPKILPCKITIIEYLSPNIIKIILRFPKNTSFEFLPGQFVNIISPANIKRSYSIVNSDFSSSLLEFHIRKFKNGIMSNYWFNDAKINDLLRIEGPKGTFGLQPNTNKNLIFLATGTGIAPIKSILSSVSSLKKIHRPKSIWIFWGNRYIDDIYFNLQELPNVDLHISVLSKPNSDWHGATGHVQDVLFGIKTSFDDCEVYACGSPQMIKDAKFMLIQYGLPEKCFFSDAFFSTDKL